MPQPPARWQLPDDPNLDWLTTLDVFSRPMDAATDQRFSSTPSGWAAHAGFAELAPR